MKRALTACLVPACLLATFAFSAEPATPLQEHMQTMRDSMSAIHNEPDPQRREELKHEQHAIMRHGMDMLADAADTANLSLEERVARLEERAALMHTMMGQMMEMHEPAGTGAQDATPPAGGHQH